jgi:hypothetical protein
MATRTVAPIMADGAITATTTGGETGLNCRPLNELWLIPVSIIMFWTMRHDAAECSDALNSAVTDTDMYEIVLSSKG